MPSSSTSRPSSVYWKQIVAGLCSGFLVSPLNVVVDKSVVEFANGKGNSIWKLAGSQLKGIVTQPHVFFPGFSFRWMYFVYSCTYVASNLGDHLNVTDLIPQPIQKLLCTFLVNTTCSLIKDKKFAQHYGTGASRPFPVAALGLFFVRDLLAMAGAFTLPKMTAPLVSKIFGISEDNGQRVSQISIPVLQQVVGTPIHLLALDLYNNPDSTVSERVASMRALFLNTMAMRMLRFLPAYGLGGIANIQIRKWLKKEENEH